MKSLVLALSTAVLLAGLAPTEWATAGIQQSAVA